MKYIDNAGDIWEDAGAGFVRVVQMNGRPAGYAEPLERARADEEWGPLRPLNDADDEPQNDPSDSLPRVTDVMGRADVFQAAHALVKGLEWGGEDPSVYDVLSVAKWLEGEG